MATMAHNRRFRLDPLATDQLHWIETVLGHLLPDARLTHSAIVRRALAQYAAYLENTFCGHHTAGQSRLSVQAEATHFLNLKNDQRVYWDQFPADGVVSEEGQLRTFRAMHSEAQKAHSKAQLEKTLKGGV